MYLYLFVIVFCWTVAGYGYWLADPAVWVAYGFINPLIFSAPRIGFFGSEVIRKRVTSEWLKNIERLGAVLLLINAPGSVYLHGLGIQYDRFLHFAAAALIYFIVLLLLSPFFRQVSSSDEKVKLLGFVFAVAFFGLFVWEGIQWSSDRLFGTQLFHDVVQPIVQDATEDILFGAAGLLLAMLALKHSKRLWDRFIVRSLK
jgi:hypothetical protein